MPRETILTTAVARIARLPFWLFDKRPLVTPKKILILKPCCLSQVMLATPLLAALARAYPDAQIDWAVSDWARPAIAGNPRLTELIRTGSEDLRRSNWKEIRQLVSRLRQEKYDTCIVPSRSGILSLIAWWAGIPQRIGLNIGGRGFAHNFAVKPQQTAWHEALIYLSLAGAMAIDTEADEALLMEFYPSDLSRTAVTELLIDELDWLGDSPLVIMHPGGGQNPVASDTTKRWPVERFVRLGNHLSRQYEARTLIIGSQADYEMAEAIRGMMISPAVNWAGRLSLDEVGALGEVADLYVGNDAGPTHISAAVGCPTLAIFGPSNPAISGPFATKARVITLWHDLEDQPFSWDTGVTVAEAVEAADSLLQREPQTNTG